MIKLPISDVCNSFAYLKHTNRSWQSFPLNLEEASHTSQHTTLGNGYQSIQASTGNEIYFSTSRLELQTHSNSLSPYLTIKTQDILRNCMRMQIW